MKTFLLCLCLCATIYATEHAVECKLGCSFETRVQDLGDKVSFHLWNPGPMQGWLGANATEALVKSQVIADPDLEIGELYFELPKSSCKMHPEYLSVFACDATGIEAKISGRTNDGGTLYLRRDLAHFIFSATRRVETRPDREDTSYVAHFEFRNGSLVGAFDEELLVCSTEFLRP